MSERKVLNKYYPPDFDPSKIPRMKLPKNRQYTVRLMAPFNMRCKTCGEYIYKGKKFNARKEDVEHEDYLGIRIYRFYIKCTRCLQEISFKTDPRNTDYEIEAGATRNFMALKLAEEQAQREEEELRDEEANNPMKLLENRTEQSKNEIELLESLEELRDLNRRHQNIDYDSMLQQYDNRETAKEREERLQKLDEEYIKSVKFSSANKRKVVVEEEIIEEISETENTLKSNNSNTISSLLDSSKSKENNLNKHKLDRSKSVGIIPRKKQQIEFVKLKKLPTNTNNTNNTNSCQTENVRTVDNITDNKNDKLQKTQNVSKSETSALSLISGYSSSDGEST